MQNHLTILRGLGLLHEVCVHSLELLQHRSSLGDLDEDDVDQVAARLLPNLIAHSSPPSSTLTAIDLKYDFVGRSAVAQKILNHSIR
jgi:hypothetical protein